MKGKKLLPVDPRPSRADPEARRIRKEMEKEHPFEWVPPIVLGLIGITLAWDVTKDVTKCEERKFKQERDKGRDEERPRRRGRGGEGRDERRHRRHDDSAAAAAAADDDGYEDDEFYDDRRRRQPRRRSADAGLDRADRLERGEGGPDDYRKRRSLAYDDDDYYDNGARFGPGRDDEAYDYEYDRRGRAYDDRRGRPRPRRQSSDW